MTSAGRSPEPIMVGPYRLIQRLGEGGMGVVHLALDQDGRAVAIKVLRPHIAADPEARLRLEREVATLRRLQHPRVAAVIDADVDGDLPYLVTTFVPGKPLDAYIKEHGPLPRGHVARVGAVLADALRAIHAAGIVHRDVKPANVMMLDGEPVLIDFGIAHLADESRITHTGLVIGTPGYLSPEIIGGEHVSAATDWWGWGATLAFAATGRPPFGTGPIEVVLDRVRRGASDLEGIDEGLRTTLSQALSVDPVSRPEPAVLVSGLAAIPPARPAGSAVIDLSRAAETEVIRTTPGAHPVRPGDRTVPRPPPGAGSGDVTMRVPPPGDRTEQLPPVNGFGDRSRVPAPEHAYAGPLAPSDLAPSPVTSSPVSSYPPPPAGSAPVTERFVEHPRDGARPPHPAGAAHLAPGAAGDAGAARAGGSDGGDGAVEAGPGWAGRLAEPIDPAVAGRGVLLGVLVVLSLIAGVAPQSAVTIVWILLAVMRVVDGANTSLLLRRQQYGPRSGDKLRMTLGLPWHFVLALVSSLFLLILPLLVGISVVFIAAAVLAGDPDQAIPSGPGSLAAGLAAVLLTAWAGPGGGAVRRGARLAVRSTVTTRRAQLIAWGVLALIAIAALMVMAQQDTPDWGPWEGTWLVRQLSR